MTYCDANPTVIPIDIQLIKSVHLSPWSLPLSLTEGGVRYGGYNEGSNYRGIVIENGEKERMQSRHTS
jgi:hypothetical protein